MLTRAARRRDTLRHLQYVADRIQLPWLCPALAKPHNTTSNRSITSRPSVAKIKPVSSPLAQSRQLASAAPLPENFERNDDYTSSSFYSQRHIPIAQRRRPDLSTLQPWDLSSIIKIDNSTALPPEQLNTNRVIGNDLRGNATEIECNLEACLLLKKWQRATASLAQLRLLHCTDPERLRFQYNKVLAFMVEDLIETRNFENEPKITQWIEREMKQAGLEPDAQTFALVIRAALGSLNGSKRDRTVRRYWDMAKRYDLQGEVGSLRDLLSDRDLGLISEICPLDAEDLSISDVAQLSPLEPEILLNEDLISRKQKVVVKETDQKGMGLVALRQSLALFSEQDQSTETTIDNESQSFEAQAESRQRRLEKDAIESAVNRWNIEHEKLAKMGITGSLKGFKAGAFLWQWHEILTAKIKDELQKVKAAESVVRKNAQDRLRVEYGPFLEQLAPEKLAAITTIAMIHIMSKFGAAKPIKLVRLVTELGKTIEAEHQAEMAAQRRLRDMRMYQKAKRSGTSTSLPESGNNTGSETGFPPLPHHNSLHPGSRLFLGRSDWTVGIHAKLGAILCEMMFDTAKIRMKRKDQATGKNVTINQPVFIRSTTYQDGKRIGMVSLHESFVEIMAARPAGDMLAKQLPMISRPRPWTAFDQGGYLESDQPVLRVKNGESLQKDYANAAAARGDLDQIFAGLDILGRTAWKINKNVFGVMVEAWNSGEAVANLPPLNKVFDTPDRPSTSASNKEKFLWFKQMREIENERSGHHSNRCFQNFQMEIAKAYEDEIFYLPHNLDFRGRAYPIPPYLNQMGADNCRGLLLFGKGRELGAEGLRWLKIHLSNVYGYDKASLTDRAQFPMDHIDDIRDSVAHPLDGKKWWLTAEDPWQCLATCFELVAALDSPDPESFVSHLPVHQDGSCNGLQHYAALGGDVAGAKQVNLEPGDKPADVYTGVAELVKAEIALEAAEGHPMAKLLDGRVTRKIVKQTVMTNVYGVTFLGAIRQVRKQVDAILPDINAMHKSGMAATYIARKIFKALGSLFTGAHDIQYWLGDCANRVSLSISSAQLNRIWEIAHSKSKAIHKPGRRAGTKADKKGDPLDSASFRTSVVWTTPLKLPVVQPYRVHKGAKIQTNLQNISLVEPSAADAVNKRKQLQAFPPNFIHSLDATHMILSALKADELGLSFSAVHDSFWTHASDVSTLNQLLRDAFIRMHSEDIVGRLAAEFNTRYKGHVYMASIHKTTPLAQAITKYRKQLAASGEFPALSGGKGIAARKHIELLREIKKIRLMNSDDPESRKEGEDMVTASSLFAQFDGEKYLRSKDSLGETAIGRIPEDTSDEVIEKALHSEDAANDVNMQSTLEELTDSVTPDNGAPEEEPGLDANEEAEPDMKAAEGQNISTEDAKSHTIEAVTKKARKKTGKSLNNQTWLWLPLTFRPVPPKGEFDVTRLRDSQYFFS